MPHVHPSAIVSKEAVLADDVFIGPGCVIQGQVDLAAGVHLVGNIYINGPVKIGENTRIFPFCAIGFQGQDWKFKDGMPTAGVVVGRDCILRENVTLHAATKTEKPTRVGDRCMLMVGSHLGHDSGIGNDVILVNSAMLAGHAYVADQATIGAGCGIHQFSRVGRLAFLSAGASVSMEVPPFCLVPERQRIGGINRVGMRRAGIPRDHITRVDEAFRTVFRSGAISKAEMVERLNALGADCPPVQELAAFVASSQRAICPGPGRPPRLLASWVKLSRRGHGQSLGATPDDWE